MYSMDVCVHMYTPPGHSIDMDVWCIVEEMFSRMDE